MELREHRLLDDGTLMCGSRRALGTPLFQMTEAVTRGGDETASAWRPPQNWPITATLSVASFPA
jgi:hypothetical protein